MCIRDSYITNNHIVFEFENTTVVSRLIEGEYFKIDQMLSSDYDTKEMCIRDRLSYLPDASEHGSA